MLEQDSWSGAGKAENDRALRDRRLLADPGGEVGYGLPRRLANDLDTASISRSSGSSTRSGRPVSRLSELDGAVVVGRPQPTRADADVRLEALGDRVGELLLAVAHDEDPAGIETQPHELGRDERPVRVEPIPADELGARDDDDGARTRRHVARYGEGARSRPSALATRTMGFLPVKPETGVPPSRNSRFPGLAHLQPELDTPEDLALALLERPSHTNSPSAEPRRTSTWTGRRRP